MAAGPALRRFAAVLILLALGSGLAHAASCASLASQLAGLESGEGGNSYDSAATRQRQELARAQGQYARNGCDSGVDSGTCGNLRRVISQMNTNLSRLERHSRRGDSTLARARIQRAMERAGCNRRASAVEEADDDSEQSTPPPRRQQKMANTAQGRGEQEEETPRPRGLLGLLMGNSRQSDDEREPPRPTQEAMRRIERLNQEVDEERDDVRRRSRDADNNGEDEERSAPGGKGGYRTLCVRMCDGYYWPVSFSTKPSRFVRDADVCKAACPNMEVELFVHRNPGQWSDDAVSVDGQPYSELRNAFRYRQKYSGDCACKPGMTPILRDPERRPVRRDEEQTNHRPALVPLAPPQPQEIAAQEAVVAPPAPAMPPRDESMAASATTLSDAPPAAPIVIMLHPEPAIGRVTDEVGLRGAVPEQAFPASMAATPSARVRVQGR